MEVKEFQKDVIEKSNEVPVLVDFWAEWCGPCKILGPVLEKLAGEANGDWELAKVDTDKNQQLAAQYGIRGIPNCKLFSKGKVINEFTGALPEHHVREWLKKSIPGKFADQIENAKKLLADGNITDAKIILENVHAGDMNNSDVNALLSKILLFEDPKEATRLAETVDPSSEYYELAESVKSICDLLEKNANPGLLPDSQIKNSYLFAINEIKKQNFDMALEKFIDIIRNDRHYDDDGSRKACIAIFKYLGEEHSITLKHRKDFGSALYV
ncbi:thioredoxin [bacterium BMS3Abin03]|nr:thioredoxin [bacterium BMS3Abin03]MCG6960706.1 thioredoxin [bacterium BMS3Abin03]